MTARLDSNENFPLPVVAALRELDFLAPASRIHARLQATDSLQGQLLRVNHGG